MILVYICYSVIYRANGSLISFLVPANISVHCSIHVLVKHHFILLQYYPFLSVDKPVNEP